MDEALRKPIGIILDLEEFALMSKSEASSPYRWVCQFLLVYLPIPNSISVPGKDDAKKLTTYRKGKDNNYIIALGAVLPK